MEAEQRDEGQARLSAGDTIAGRYRVAELVGRGGMGEVYRAEHLLTGQHVALKLVRRSSEDARRRLLREAKAASRLKSPHTARVLDADTLASGDPFLVFELLEGQDLASILRARGRLSTADAVACVAQAADALAEAHGLGIVHRDVKPSNLFMVARPGPLEIKVLDFGIAKVDAASDTSVTITGSVMGSPRYMSPEQIRDPKRTDARTDVWSLGVTLHELLTGYAPFEESYAPALCAMITSEPPSLRIAKTDDASARLVAIIERCLAKDRRERFESARELGDALRAIELGGAEEGVSLRPASARTTNDDTLEPQDTSSRAPTRPSQAPTPEAGRSRLTTVAVGTVALLAAGVWWAREPTDPPASAATATTSDAVSSAPIAEGGPGAVVEPEPEAVAPVVTGPIAAESATPSTTSSAGVSGGPRTSSSTRRGGTPTATASATPADSAPAVLDEAAVLKDRR